VCILPNSPISGVVVATITNTIYSRARDLRKSSSLVKTIREVTDRSAPSEVKSASSVSLSLSFSFSFCLGLSVCWSDCHDGHEAFGEICRYGDRRLRAEIAADDCV